MSSRELLVQVLAVVGAVGTATTNLVLAVAVMPFWKSLEPDAFLDWFSKYASRFGLISPPFGLLGAIFSAWALTEAEGNDARWLWGLSLALLVASLAVLPAYFVRTNTKFYKRTLPESEVMAEVKTWSRWHWSRTIGPMAAVVLTIWATAISA